MALKVRKTEHAGPKRGRGGYWGRRADAKHDSSRKRRRLWKKGEAVREA